MECSGKAVQVVLLEKDKRKRVICNVESQHTQIGDHNKAIVDPKIFRGADDVPNITRLDIRDIVAGANTSGSPTEVAIEGSVVQVVLREDDCLDYMNIDVNSIDDSTVQIGNNTELRLNRGNTKVASNNRAKTHRPRNPQRRATHATRKKNPPRNSKKKRDEESLINHETSQLSHESKELYSIFFRDVLAVLHPLRDNGKWDEFDEKLNQFRVAYGSKPAWDILFTLEQGQQICYHSYDSNIAKAESKLFEGLDMVKKCKDLDPSISQLCQGRAYCYLTSVYRRANKFGKAQQFIELAEKCLENTIFLYDKASMYYEKASLLLVFDRKGSHAREIKTSLDKCSELCAEINKDEKWEFVKKGYFAKVKKVMLLCDCSTKPGRKRRISDEDLEEAKKCLKELEEENQTRCQVLAVSEQIVGLLAKSDKEFRCHCFRKAKEIAEEANALAKTHGFDEQPALKRLQDIESMIRLEFVPAQQQQTLMNVNVMSGDADVSTTADETE